MSDRVSTFRFKAEGLDTIGADLRRYAAQYRAQLAESNKAFSVAQRGEQMGVPAEDMKASYDKGVQAYIASETSKKRFESASWETSKKQYAEQRKMEDEHAKIVASVEDPRFAQAAQSNKIATSYIDKEREARAAALKADILAREKAVQSQFQAEASVADARDDQAAKTNKTATSYIDEERNARAAALKADILAREKAVQDRFKIEANEANEAEKITKNAQKANDAFVKQKAADNKIAASGTIKGMKEVAAFEQKKSDEETNRIKSAQKLNDDFVKQKIAGERARVASVAASIKGMEEEERIEKKKIKDAEGGKDGMGLKGFGGKMILGHAAGMAAGDILGDRHGGQELGSVVGALMFGNPQIALAVAGIEIIGSAFRGHREQVEASRKALTEYTDALSKVITTWGELATSLINNSPFGSNMEKQVQAERQLFLKASAEQAKIIQDKPNFADLAASGMASGSNWLASQKWANFIPGISSINTLARDKINGGKDFNTTTAYETGIDSQRRQMELAEQVELVATNARNKEYPKYMKDQQAIHDAEKQVYATASMMPGALKEQATLTAQIHAEEVKRVADNRQQIEQANIALAVAQKQYDGLVAIREEVNKTGTPAQKIQARREADVAYNELMDAATAVIRLPGQIVMRDQAANDKAKAAQDALTDKNALALRDQKVKTNEAIARAEKDGYAQTAAVRKIAFADEEVKAEEQSPAMLAEVQKMHAAMRNEAQKENLNAIESALAPYNSATAARVQKRQRADWEAKEATPDEIRQIETGKYLLQIEQDQINAKVAKRNITIRQGELERALLADRITAATAEGRATIERAVDAKIEAENQQSIAQLRIAAAQSELDIEFERHQLTVDEYELKKALAANPMAQEDDALKIAIIRAHYAEKEAATTRDIMNYRQQGMEADLDRAAKYHRISLMDADIAKMILHDRRAQDPGQAGDSVRAEIVELAKKKQLLRDMEILNAGEFSGRFRAGQVNFAALNQNHPYGFYRGMATDQGASGRFAGGRYNDFGALNQNGQLEVVRATESNGAILANIQGLLTTIARTGGLN